MPQTAHQNTPLSSLFQDPLVRDAFERAERDVPPAGLAVEPKHAPVLNGGAVVRVLELA